MAPRPGQLDSKQCAYQATWRHVKIPNDFTKQCASQIATKSTAEYQENPEVLSVPPLHLGSHVPRRDKRLKLEQLGLGVCPMGSSCLQRR